MKAAVRLLVVAASVLAAACDPTPAPASATQSAAPSFSPLDAGVSARDAGSIIRDGGAPASDAGVARGVTVLSSNNRLPAPWLVSDATQLARLQPLDAGSPALYRVGQLVTLQVATMTSNTMVDADHCPSVFMNACNGFAASDSAGHIVLVDTFVLLGSGMSTCAARFNGAALSSITGVWASRLLTDGTTSYSLAIASCAGVGVDSDPVGTVTPAASTDIQILQANYPADKPTVTVRGIVVGVAMNQTKLRTVFIEDPAGGERAGITVFSSAGLSPAPAVGDAVIVTAVAELRGDAKQLVVP